MSKKKKVQESSSVLRLLPVYIASGIIPLIVYLKRIELKGILYETWKGSNDFGDFFNYYKSAGIIIVAVFAIILLLSRKNKNKLDLKEQKIFIPALAYVLLVIISTIFSEHIEVALFGYIERHEGIFVLLSYIVICFYTACIVQNEADIAQVFTFMSFSCVIIGVIGFSQHIGKDFFQTTIGLKLIMPQMFHPNIDNIKATIGAGVYGTFNNPNYVGSYSCILLIVSLGLFCCVKVTRMRIVSSLLFITAASFLWTGSLSRAGLVGGMIGIIMFLILQAKKFMKDWRYIGGIIMIVLTTISIDFLSGGRSLHEFNRLGLDQEIEQIQEENLLFRVEEIKAEANQLIIRTNSEVFKMEQEIKEVKFLDGEDNILFPSFHNDIYFFTDTAYERYKILVVKPGEEYLLNVDKYPIRVRYDGQTFQKVTPAGGSIEIQKAEGVPFLNGLESFGSGRGYIWSRSIPMIKETIFKGHGPDTYAIYFPQGDLAGKINGLNDPNVIVDKPHNWYLQTAINTGLVSLICILSFLVIYIVTTVKAYIVSKNENGRVLQSAIFAAILGYCASMFFNDSVVSVAPVFWVLLGLGIAENRILINRAIKK